VQRVAVVGSGYVGTVVAASFAWIGHDVVGLELDEQKVASLSRGVLPFHEPELEDLIRAGIANERLRFTSDVADAVSSSDCLFLCVGTPSGVDGRPDLTAFESALRSIAAVMEESKILVTKSTVPVGTGNWVQSIMDDEFSRRTSMPPSFAVVSNPEFLREGLAVSDFLYPDRIVVGSDDEDALKFVADLYSPIVDQSFPHGGMKTPSLLRTSLCAAEMIKYAANAFLATKISFANEVANICLRVGADAAEVADAIGLDSRIGRKFLDAGVGWGGSCFTKDLTALITTASELGYDASLLRAAIGVNVKQRTSVLDKLQRHLGALLGRRVALLGLAFKPGTDDLRDAPAVDVARWLITSGATVRAHDPVVQSVPALPQLIIEDDPYVAAARADAVVLFTEWPEYELLDLSRLRSVMRGDVFIDGRNVFAPHAVTAAGFTLETFGRFERRALAVVG
jgi:UDPglucose 6-dehydrogenase